ncbi:hypothetical protein ACIQCR_11130 [Streptomyces sp. NPDC093249]|uniref:hypothetical protein n=1 Tax=unclassified Streptomyces TaxID=2593676 RepID=UPI00383073C6
MGEALARAADEDEQIALRPSTARRPLLAERGERPDGGRFPVDGSPAVVRLVVGAADGGADEAVEAVRPRAEERLAGEGPFDQAAA